MRRCVTPTSAGTDVTLIVPTLRVGTPLVTLCVTLWDAERPGLHSHAERGNDQCGNDHPQRFPEIVDNKSRHLPKRDI